MTPPKIPCRFGLSWASISGHSSSRRSAMEPTTRGRYRDIINFEIHRLALEVLRPAEQNVLPNSSLHMWSQDRFDLCLGHTAADSAAARPVLAQPHRRDRHELKPGGPPRVLATAQLPAARTT